MSSDPDLIGVLVASLDVLVALRAEVETLEQEVERLARKHVGRGAGKKKERVRFAQSCSLGAPAPASFLRLHAQVKTWTRRHA